MSKNKSLVDEYRFAGFRPKRSLKGIFGDPHARLIELVRRQKKLNALAVEKAAEVSMTETSAWFVICHAAANGFT